MGEILWQKEDASMAVSVDRITTPLQQLQEAEELNQKLGWGFKDSDFLIPIPKPSVNTDEVPLLVPHLCDDPRRAVDGLLLAYQRRAESQGKAIYSLLRKPDKIRFTDDCRTGLRWVLFNPYHPNHLAPPPRPGYRFAGLELLAALLFLPDYVFVVRTFCVIPQGINLFDDLDNDWTRILFVRQWPPDNILTVGAIWQDYLQAQDCIFPVVKDL